MLTCDVSEGIQLKIPVLLSKYAPDGKSLLSHRYVVLLSGSIIVAIVVELIPTVTL